MSEIPTPTTKIFNSVAELKNSYGISIQVTDDKYNNFLVPNLDCKFTQYIKTYFQTPVEVTNEKVLAVINSLDKLRSKETEVSRSDLQNWLWNARGLNVCLS